MARMPAFRNAFHASPPLLVLLTASLLTSASSAEEPAASSPRQSNPLRSNSAENVIPPSVPLSAASVPAVAERLASLRAELESGELPRVVFAIHQMGTLGQPGAIALLEWLPQQPHQMETTMAVQAVITDLGAEGVPAVLAHLSRCRGDDRLFAWQLLAAMGPTARAALPQCLETLRASQATDEERYAAIQVVENLGTVGAPAIPFLLNIAEGDGDEELRTTALATVARLVPWEPGVSTRLSRLVLQDGQPPVVRATAGRALTSAQQRPEYLLPVVLGLLTPDADTEVWEPSLAVIGDLGPAAGEAHPRVLSILKHESPELRQQGIEALEKLAIWDIETGETLVRLAQSDEDSRVRAAAARAVAINIPTSTPNLVAGLSADNREVVQNTLEWLPTVGSIAVQFVPRLRAMLGDPEVLELRLEVLRALRELGPPSTEALPEITACLISRAQPTEVRAAAAVAIGAISAEPVAELSAALQDESLDVRIGAAQGLAHQDFRRRTAIPWLVRQLADPTARTAACRALSELGTDSVPELERVLFDQQTSTDWRVAVCECLADLGPSAAPLLVRALSSGDEDVSAAAERALWNVGPRATLPAVVQILRSPTNPERSTRLLQLLADMSGGMGGPERGAAETPRHAAMEAASPENGPTPVLPTPMAPAPLPSAPSRSAPRAPAIGAGQTIKAQGADTQSAAAPLVDAPEMNLRTVKVFYGTDRRPIGLIGGTTNGRGFRLVAAVVVAILTILTGNIVWRRASSPRAAGIAFSGIGLAVMLAWLALRTAPPATPPQFAAGLVRPGPVFGFDHDSTLHLGACEVTIPREHAPGELERPSIWKLQFTEDPAKHIVLREVGALDESSFHEQLRSDLARRGNHLLVFVHGYNVSFDDAARRTAQLSLDLDFAGVPVFFSWPSQANWYDYRRDEKQVELAVPLLRQFLLQIARQSQADSIHLIAHSMGNRALTGALRELQADTESRQTRFNQVILAAPDIDAEIFRERIAPAVTAAAERVTLYASSNDLALLASRTFNGGDSRAGDTRRGLLVTTGVETIDVSAVDTSLLGHSYYGDNPTVLTDLKEMLRTRHSADQRPFLTPLPLDTQRYWVFRAPAIAQQSRVDVK